MLVAVKRPWELVWSLWARRLEAGERVFAERDVAEVQVYMDS